MITVFVEQPIAKHLCFLYQKIYNYKNVSFIFLDFFLRLQGLIHKNFFSKITPIFSRPLLYQSVMSLKYFFLNLILGTFIYFLFTYIYFLIHLYTFKLCHLPSASIGLPLHTFVSSQVKHLLFLEEGRLEWFIKYIDKKIASANFSANKSIGLTLLSKHDDSHFKLPQQGEPC